MGVEIDPSFLPLTDNKTLYVAQPKDFLGNPIAPQTNARYITSPMHVTSSLTMPAPDGSSSETVDYQYQGAQVQTGFRGRGYLGFHRFVATSSLTGLTAYREMSQTFPYTGQTVRTATIQDGHLLNVSSSTYDHTVQNRLGAVKTYFPYVTVTGSQEYELKENGGALYRSRSVNLTYDAYGNVKTQTTN